MDAVGMFQFLVIGSCQVWATEDILKYEHKHRTHKAVEKANGLWCHRCYTMDVNSEFCMNVTRNDSSLHHKCEGDMRTCMVKRISYSTTNSSGSTVHKVWSMERNCTQKCEPGCIIIGERTKIRVCSTCCESPFCNIGTGASDRPSLSKNFLGFVCFFLILRQHLIDFDS